MDIVIIITKVAQSVKRLHQHMREDVDTTRQWSKHTVNAAITFYNFKCLNAYH